jgi:16S rRNA (guanine527-N7)-methyltransferase
MLDATRMAELLQPFLGDQPVPPELYPRLNSYLDLLLRWNARVNLTAVRDPEQIVTRHFGESLFAARVLRDAGALAGTPTLSDIGSGAGFPGIPIKLLLPNVQLTLIESQNKKSTFLREVLRTLSVEGAEVFSGRAEAWGKTAGVVTLRAVEKFAAVLPVAANVVSTGGALCLLIGENQVEIARSILGSAWEVPDGRRIPKSGGRIVLLARGVRLDFSYKW